MVGRQSNKTTDDNDDHYLKKELYQKLYSDPTMFEFLQNCALDGLWYWNLENTEDEWMSARFWETLGYDPAAQPHKASAWQSLIFPEDKALALASFEQHLNNPDHPYDLVVRYWHRNGSTVWIRCRGIIIRDNQGKALRMLGAHTDITGIKQAQEERDQALRERKNYLQALFDNALDSIFTLDPQGMILSCNQTMSRTLGYSRGELTSRFFDEIIATGHRTTDYLTRLNQGHPSIKRKLKTDIQVVNRQGKRLDMSMTLGKIPSPEGETLIGSLHDISERKRVEKLKDAFVSTVNHELRTPLTSIQCNIDLLAKQWQRQWSESGRELLSIAQANTLRIVNIVNDILDMQKLLLAVFRLNGSDSILNP